MPVNQSRFTNEENAMNTHVTQFSDLDDLFTANHVDVSAARLVKAIRTKDTATYIEIVSTPKGRVSPASTSPRARWPSSSARRSRRRPTRASRRRRRRRTRR
jgi:hypothetical protein